MDAGRCRAKGCGWRARPGPSVSRGCAARGLCARSTSPKPCTRTAVSPGRRLSRSGSPTCTSAGMRMARLGERPRAVRARVGRGVSQRPFDAGRVEGTRLPAGLSFTSCLPGLCFTSCLPGSASPPACRGSASPPANRGRRLDGADRQPLALRLPGRPLCATEPAERAHSCRVAPLIGQKKPATYPRRPGQSPSRLDNPNRPVSILSNSEPALCALAPARSHQAPAVPARSPGFARSCRRARVAAATPKPAQHAPRLALSPGRNHRNGDPPPPNAFRHFSPCPPALLPTG
jgi:hypothetical protein